jgi:hypothetical protein
MAIVATAITSGVMVFARILLVTRWLMMIVTSVAATTALAPVVMGNLGQVLRMMNVVTVAELESLLVTVTVMVMSLMTVTSVMDLLVLI